MESFVNWTDVLLLIHMVASDLTSLIAHKTHLPVAKLSNH